MPRASEYSSWAVQLNAKADALTSLAGPLISAATPEVLIGGRFAMMIDTAFRASLANSQSAGSMLRAHGDECVRRAGVCAAYTTAMNVYEAECASFPSRQAAHNAAVEEAKGRWPVGYPPVYPVAPVREGPWVERG